MKRLGGLVSLVVCWGFTTCNAVAQPVELTSVTVEVQPVGNAPSAAYSTFKRVVNTLNPQYETFFNMADGTWSQSVSASLYNFHSHDIPLGSVRAGWSTGEIGYAGVSLDLPGLTKRYVPETVQGIATTGYLKTLWALAGRYARAGVVGGYSWSDEKAVYGLTAGAALRW